MRHKGRWRLAALVVVLLSGAAAFRLLAPEDYGLPPIEILDPGPTGLRIAADGIFGNYYPAGAHPSGARPATVAGRHAGILLLGGSEGGLGEGARQMALSLQAEGFSVLHLAYFGVPGTRDSLERIPLELFDRGLSLLAQQPEVDGRRLALVGASKGAEAVLLVATRHERLRAVVAGMPTSVVWKGVDWKRGGQSVHSSWTSGGMELSTMPFAAWNPREGVISVYRSIEDPARRVLADGAAIPVERARAAVMLVCGEAETMWPACPMSRDLAARAAGRGGPPVAVLAYRDAGHLVFGPPVPRSSPFYKRLDMLGGTVEGNAAARADGWPRVVAFLKAQTETI